MLFNRRILRLKILFGIFITSFVFLSCQKEKKPDIPEAVKVAPKKLEPLRTESPAPELFQFTSHPSLKTFVGKPYLYKPTFSIPGNHALTLVKAPDSMRLADGIVKWKPMQPGHFSIILEAVEDSQGGKKESPQAKNVSHRIQQGFILAVDPVLSLVLKPFPNEVKRGDTVTFDLSGSTFPDWAISDLSLRFDFEGDGKWDLEKSSWPSHGIFKRVFDQVGHFKPRVEGSYKNLETQSVDGEISVKGRVSAILNISPILVEPGGKMVIDASASIGDGRLVYSVDLNGDGKVDWQDSASGKTSILAPLSGKYRAELKVRNAIGQEGQGYANYLVNAKPTLEIKVRNPKVNMVTEVQIRAHVKDIDDSLVSTRINFTGDSSDWTTRTSPPDSQINEKDWLLRFHHSYSKVGKFSVTLCVTSKDGREECISTPVEIFNAPPICLPGENIHATLGKPMDIEGSGSDPDGKIVKWEWDLNGDGKYDLISSQNGKLQYTFSKLGTFPLLFRITTLDGVTATAIRKVEVRKKWKG